MLSGSVPTAARLHLRGRRQGGHRARGELHEGADVVVRGAGHSAVRAGGLLLPVRRDDPTELRQARGQRLGVRVDLGGLRGLGLRVGGGSDRAACGHSCRQQERAYPYKRSLMIRHCFPHRAQDLLFHHAACEGQPVRSQSLPGRTATLLFELRPWSRAMCART